MKKLILIFLLGLLIASAATAAVPSQMNVQGRLLNNGDPMIGSHPAIFSIYDAATGGNLLWTESSSLDVQGGIFTATLGSTTPIPTIVFDSQPRWLEVTVDGSILNPRLPLTTSAYAFWSQRADTADVALSGAAGTELWSTDGTNVWRASGKVGIGTTSPGELLHLENGSGTGATMLVRSYVPGTGSFGKLQFQNVLATGAGIAAEIEAVRPVATWGQESDLLFKTNPGSPSPALAERMRIARDGNVGIGRSADLQARLFVDTPEGSVPNYGILRVGSADYTGQTNNVVLSLAPGVVNFDAAGVTGGRFKIDAAGNVGIGTTNPTTKLYVNGDFTATGTKCREVDDPKYGKLYFNAVESDHANFTSSGRAVLKNGKCHVDLDPRWLAGVTIDIQHPLDVTAVVFYGRHGSWYAVPGTTGFDIIDPDGGNSEFCWTAQARQKGYEDLDLNRPEPTAAK